MKILLLLISLGSGGFAYYEYSLTQQHAAAYEQQAAEENAQYTKAAAENQALLNDNARLSRSLSSLQQQAAAAPAP
jgi:hypothetical protein